MKRITLALALLVATTATGAYAETEHQGNFRYNYTLVSSQVPPNWKGITKYEDNWEDVGDEYGCSNWSPSTASQGKGVSFIQTATDCQQNQEKGAQNYRVNNINNQEVKDGPRYTIKRTITVSATRDAVGILENWLGIAPTYTSWIDTNPLYGCTAWSPNPSTYTATTNFTQTSSTCKTDQERQRQEREQEKFTSEIRNNGASVTEQQTLNSQTATRPYTVTLGDWTAVGGAYQCANWSPAVETVGKGLKFTQTATDCQLNQTRTRAESYKDHLTNQVVSVGVANENRTLTNQGNSQDATGTMETWVATSPVYTAWANSSGLYGCGTYSPSPAAYTTATQFNQTAYCSVNQSRTRQDRESETYTGAIRNVGVPVAESQTLGSQPTTRTYLMDFTAWANSSGYYSCSAWSPDVSTVNAGTVFTQAAYCYINQQRGAAGYTYNGGWVPDPAVPYRTETQTLANQYVTQQATGTKSTCQYVAGNTQWTYQMLMDHNMHTIVYLNGSVVYTRQGQDTQMTYGGATYYRGAVVSANTIWQLCKM